MSYNNAPCHWVGMNLLSERCHKERGDGASESEVRKGWVLHHG